MTEATTSPFSFSFKNLSPEAFANFLPDTDSMGTLARGAMEASTASTRASVKGLQEVGQSMVAHMKDQMSLTVETGKKLAGAGSLSDAMTIQTGYVKSSFEKNVKNFNDISDLYTDTLIEAFAPIAKQAKKAAKTVKTD